MSSTLDVFHSHLGVTVSHKLAQLFEIDTSTVDLGCFGDSQVMGLERAELFIFARLDKLFQSFSKRIFTSILKYLLVIFISRLFVCKTILLQFFCHVAKLQSDIHCPVAIIFLTIELDLILFSYELLLFEMTPCHRQSILSTHCAIIH